MRFILPFFVILAGVVAAESSGIAFYDDFALCNTTFEDADGVGSLPSVVNRSSVLMLAL